MGKKTKLNEVEAGIIIRYLGVIHIEGASIYKSAMELMEKKDMFINDEAYNIYEEIGSRLFIWTKSYIVGNIFTQLENIMTFRGKYISSSDLRKLEIDTVEFPKELERDVTDFYNKLIETGKDVEELETLKTETLKSIKNMYFSIDRIKEVIERKC